MKLLRDQELCSAVVDMRAGEGDGHEHDLVMPGFRFHPTEEELIEFYLRRKVEGRRFNIDLIAFLDLYSYDPWELPEMARIGEKEWYFYVPRDRKYRNGDRPNRVTRSGYWKATGADRMVKGEAPQRPIGLKKTLVFYRGKAPKGVRSSWIMNEYRLPHTTADHPHHFHHIHKTEISLCRVYKRAGVEDHCQLPGTLNPNKKHPPPPPPQPPPPLPAAALLHSSTPPKPPEICSDLPSLPIIYESMTAAASVANSLSSTASMEEDTSSLAQYHSVKPPFHLPASADQLDGAMGYRNNGESLPTMLQPLHEQIVLPPLNQYLSLPMISEKLWEWWNCNPNPTVSDAGKDFTGFK
ncbi:NAC transcription factor 32-like [Zingiber officinale]|uniref:NAC transcription factor 32-like n=1 Tax=Zingiber officinale TaxID=94328 RepID=UPI001C4B6B55|nr:NAC transcription factor 32-like [Zingiber officinale]